MEIIITAFATMVAAACSIALIARDRDESALKKISTENDKEDEEK
jgi:hypothetical protein